MISIIVPSINAEALENFRGNVTDTVGVEYEIISYNNSEDGYGICKIYNICAQKAKYQNLVFCHDDIIFHTHNWGKELLGLLKDKTIGIVGITGATFKSRYPAPWVSIPTQYYRSNLGSKKGSSEIVENKAEDVAVIDGCFMAMRKEVWKEYKFDEKNLQGFHIYDIDISIRVFQQLRVVVAKSISMEHLSPGVFDDKWYKQSKDYHLIKHELLPVSIEEESEKKKLDTYALRSLLFRSRSLKLSPKEKINLFLELLIKNPRMISIRMLRVVFFMSS